LVSESREIDRTDEREERIGRISPLDGANIYGVERNFTFGAAEQQGVDLGQQSPRNLHVPSAKNDSGVVRLPHMRAAR
jgi:hypothetical protein